MSGDPTDDAATARCPVAARPLGMTPGEMAAPLIRLLGLSASHPDPDAVLAEVGGDIRCWPLAVRAEVAECCEQVAWFCRDGAP